MRVWLWRGLVVAAMIVAMAAGVWASVRLDVINTGMGILVGSVAYSDGGAVDVVVYGRQVQITAIFAETQVAVTRFPLTCSDGTAQLMVTAAGRAVHLIAEGENQESCGVDHYRYWLPDGMVGLEEGRSVVFVPVVMGR